MSAFPGRTVIAGFHLVERMMGDVVEVVPYCPDHYDVWSPHLITILLETGSQLDSLWKTRHKAMLPGVARPDITDYSRAFGGDVAKRWLLFWGEEGERVQPFAPWEGVADYVQLPWWKAHTDVKHDRLLNRKMATLGTAVHAFAALFIAIVQDPDCADFVLREGWVSAPDLHGLTPTDFLGGRGPEHVEAAETKLLSYPLRAGSGELVTMYPTSSSYRLRRWRETNDLRQW